MEVAGVNCLSVFVHVYPLIAFGMQPTKFLSSKQTMAVPNAAAAAVLQPSEAIPHDAISVRGPDFEEPLSLDTFLASYERIGFQAQSLGKAMRIVDQMVGKLLLTIQSFLQRNMQRNWRLSDEPILTDESERYLDPEVRARTRCNIFLGYTSNLISSGLREVIRYLVKHRHVFVLVTTAGGIEEDFIKCLGKTYLADFNLDGAELRSKGMNRIGNLIVPNDNYCKFEDWLTPILDTMLAEQKATGQVWTPSSFIRRLGKEINNEESIYYWAYKVSNMWSLEAIILQIQGCFIRTISLSFVLLSPTDPLETCCIFIPSDLRALSWTSLQTYAA